MKTWTLQLPRCRCPNCNTVLRIKFVGRLRVLRTRKARDEKGEGLDREGIAIPCEGVDDEEVQVSQVPVKGDKLHVVPQEPQTIK